MGKRPYRFTGAPERNLPVVMTMADSSGELRDLHAAHRAELGALREMLAGHGPTGNHRLDTALAERMRDTLAEILRLQKILSRLDE